MHLHKQRKLRMGFRIIGKIRLRADQKRTVLEHHPSDLVMRTQPEKPAEAVFCTVCDHIAEDLPPVVAHSQRLAVDLGLTAKLRDHNSASCTAAIICSASARQACASESRITETGACRYRQGTLTASTLAP